MMQALDTCSHCGGNLAPGGPACRTRPPLDGEWVTANLQVGAGTVSGRYPLACIERQFR